MNGEMGCEQVREVAAELAIGIADGQQRDAALGHAAACPDCRRLISELSSVVDDLLLLAPSHEPPPGFAARTVARRRRATPAAARHIRRGRRWVPRLVVAASVVAALAVGAGAAYEGTASDRQLPGRAGPRPRVVLRLRAASRAHRNRWHRVRIPGPPLLAVRHRAPAEHRRGALRRRAGHPRRQAPAGRHGRPRRHPRHLGRPDPHRPHQPGPAPVRLRRRADHNRRQPQRPHPLGARLTGLPACQPEAPAGRRRGFEPGVNRRGAVPNARHRAWSGHDASRRLRPGGLGHQLVADRNAADRSMMLPSAPERQPGGREAGLEHPIS